jgi:hypothetical protein
MIDKYQEEPPSNQEWTDGDNHPDIVSTDDWNVVPLDRHEAHNFQCLLGAVSVTLRNTNVFTHRALSHRQALMKMHYTRWTSDEWTSDCEI